MCAWFKFVVHKRFILSLRAQKRPTPKPLMQTKQHPMRRPKRKVSTHY